MNWVLRNLFLLNVRHAHFPLVISTCTGLELGEYGYYPSNAAGWNRSIWIVLRKRTVIHSIRNTKVRRGFAGMRHDFSVHMLRFGGRSGMFPPIFSLRSIRFLDSELFFAALVRAVEVFSYN